MIIVSTGNGLLYYVKHYIVMEEKEISFRLFICKSYVII